MRSVKKLIQKFSNLYNVSRPMWMALVAITLCLIIGVSTAFYNFASNKLLMQLGMGNFNITAEQGISKDSGVKNNTGRKAYVRAYIVPCWQQTNEDGTVKSDQEYLGYSEWDISEKLNSGELTVNDTDWRKDGNYYYYKKVLNANDSTSALVTSFSGESTYASQRMPQYNPKIILANDLKSNTLNKNYIYPHLKVFDYVDRKDTVVKPYKETSDVSTVRDIGYAGGTGTEADPFLIATGEQLLKCVTSSGVAENGAKLHFRLITDIYLSSFQTLGGEKPTIRYDQWVFNRDKKSRFCGCFDGNGYTVNGLYIGYDKNKYGDPREHTVNDNDNVSTTNADGTRHDKTFGGLFPCLGPGAEIRNLGIIEPILWNLPYSGAIAGYVCARSADDEPVIIENCFVQNGSNSYTANNGCGSEGFNSHSEVDGDAIGGLIGYAELASSTTSGEPLLKINNFYISSRFDIWYEKGGTIDTKPRSATVGASNNPSKISVSNGYTYFVTENNTGTAAIDTTGEDSLTIAPSGAATLNVFSHKQTSNMKANYNNIKNALGSVTTSNGVDHAWSFERINEASIYPAGGLLVSTEFIRSQSNISTQETPKYLAKEAYKVVYELIQAEGTSDGSDTKTPIEDSWFKTDDFVENTDIQTLKNEFSFYSASDNSHYQNDSTNFYNPNTVYLASRGDPQSTLSGTNYPRLQINFFSDSSLRSIWQTYDDLIADDGFLDKVSTPYITYNVYAPKAGNYKIAPEFVVDNSIENKNDMFFVVSVNDKDYYRNNFATISNNFTANPVEVKLEEGLNVVRIICTKELSVYYQNGKWMNHCGIWLENNANLSVKPARQNYIDFANTVNGATETYVASKNYNNNNGQDCLNVGISADANSNLITMENLNSKTLQYLPYAALKVRNDGVGGFYDISLAYNTKTTGVTKGYIVIRANGVNYKRHFRALDGTHKTPLNISVYLKSGINNITITAPLETTSPEDYYLGYVSWFNQWGITIMGDSTVVQTSDKTFDPYLEDPDANYLVPPHISLLEAEIYALANRYGQIESTGRATVIGGISPWYLALPDWSGMPTDRFIERNENYYLNDNASPHVDFTICAPVAGKYKIKPKLYIKFKDNKYFNGCNFFIMVNDKFKKIPIAESELTNEADRYWYQSEIEVELIEGVNVIRLIPVDRNNTFMVSDGTNVTERSYGIEWFNFDYLELVSDELIGLKPQTEFRGAIQAHYTFGYGGALYNTTVTSTAKIGYNFGNGDYGNVSDLFSRYCLMHIAGGKLDTSVTPANITLNNVSNKQYGVLQDGFPAISYTVRAPTAGYYSLTLSMGGTTNMIPSKSAVFVNNGVDSPSSKRKYIIDFMDMGDKRVLDGRMDCSVYLEKGINVITITCPVDQNFVTGINNVKRWFNFGTLRIAGGAEFAPYGSRINPIAKWSTKDYVPDGRKSWVDLMGGTP